jgi:hypothetical protein
MNTVSESDDRRSGWLAWHRIVAFSMLASVVARVFDGSGGSAPLATLMHGADDATTGRVPLDPDVVLVDDVVTRSLLTGIPVSHALFTWSYSS